MEAVVARSVTVRRAAHDSSYDAATTTTVFDVGGVAVFAHVDAAGRTSISLYVMYPEIDIDSERETAYQALRHVETVRPHPKRLDRQAARVLEIAQGLAERRLAGWRLRSGWGGPWKPDTGLSTALGLCGGFCIVDGELITHGYVLREGMTAKQVAKAIRRMPVGPPVIGDRTRVPVLLLAEAGRDAEEAACINAYASARPELDGEEIGEAALAALS